MPPCPHIPGADISHKTVNGLRVVLDCTLFDDDWHEGMPEGLHECGTGRVGLPCPEPEPNNFNLVLYHKPDLRLDWDRMGFLPEHLPPRKGPSRGEALGLLCVQPRSVLGGHREVSEGVREDFWSECFLRPYRFLYLRWIALLFGYYEAFVVG